MSAFNYEQKKDTNLHIMKLQGNYKEKILEVSIKRKSHLRNKNQQGIYKQHWCKMHNGINVFKVFRENNLTQMRISLTWILEPLFFKWYWVWDPLRKKCSPSTISSLSGQKPYNYIINAISQFSSFSINQQTQQGQFKSYRTELLSP